MCTRAHFFIWIFLTERRPPGQSRIVGGRVAQYGEANYQVFSFNFFDNSNCGGTLVELNGLRFVTTAAHCLWVRYSNVSFFIFRYIKEQKFLLCAYCLTTTGWY